MSIKPDSLTERVDLAAEFWRVVAKQFPAWQQVYDGKVTCR